MRRIGLSWRAALANEESSAPLMCRSRPACWRRRCDHLRSCGVPRCPRPYREYDVSLLARCRTYTPQHRRPVSLASECILRLACALGLRQRSYHRRAAGSRTVLPDCHISAGIWSSISLISSGGVRTSPVFLTRSFVFQSDSGLAGSLNKSLLFFMFSSCDLMWLRKDTSARSFSGKRWA
jgi:hypothetical protein